MKRIHRLIVVDWPGVEAMRKSSIRMIRKHFSKDVLSQNLNVRRKQRSEERVSKWKEELAKGPGLKPV